MEKETSLIKKVLTTEVKYVIAIIAFVFGVANPYYTMRQDIALIQKDISTINSNHEVHIQDIMAELKEQKGEIADLQKQLILVANAVNTASAAVINSSKGR